MIEVSGIAFSFESADSSKIEALRGVDLSLEPGELVSLMGPNGSGKSTLARIMAGLLMPCRGDVRIDGKKLTAGSWELRSKVGIVFQNPESQLVATTLEEEVAFGPENLGLERSEIRERVEWSLRLMELAELREEQPHQLSGGQKQRLAIASVLAMRPEYLILDEPASMLDLRGQTEMEKALEVLLEQGTGVLLITQRAREAKKADRMLLMEEGRLLASGEPGVIFSDGRLLEGSRIDVPLEYRLMNLLEDRISKGERFKGIREVQSLCES